MSTTPKGPNPDDPGARKPGEPPVARPMDQTFLGVAPPAPAAPKTPSGSAIIAAPMIAVSGKPSPNKATPPPAAPAARSEPPAAPAGAGAGRSTQLSGGWESANVAPRGAPDRTLLHASPQAAPAQPRPQAFTQPSAPPAAPTQTPFPRPAAPEQFAHKPSAPPVQVQRPAPDDLGNRTALASDYLRAARDAALGQSAPPRDQRTPPPAGVYEPSPQPPAEPRAVHHQPPQAYQPQPYHAPQAYPSPQPEQHHAPPHQYQPPEPVQAPKHVDSPASAPAPATVAPPTAPPDDLPLEPRAGERVSAPAFSPRPAFGERDELEGPRSLGTQASVAPPREPSPAPAPRASAPAPAAEAVRPPPRSMAGTMLEQPPSIPIRSAGTAPVSTFGSGPASVPAPAQVTRFEAVPSVRAPLAEQPPASFGGSAAPMDMSVAWNSRDSESTQEPKLARDKDKDKPKGASQVRLIALAAVAVLAIGFATFSDQLKGTRTSKTARRQSSEQVKEPTSDTTSREAAAGTDEGQTKTLANRPSDVEAGQQAAAQEAAPSQLAQNTAATAATAQAAAAATPEAAAGSESAEGSAEQAPVDDANASPEAKLAASAGRHVIAGRYAEALPIYQQLAQSSPQNTAYAAMVRVLKQKTGAAVAAPAAAP